MMNKSNKAILLMGLWVALFSLIMLVLPVTKNAVFWVSFGFGLVGLLFVYYVMYQSIKGADSIKKRFMRTSVMLAAYQYLVLQMISSFGFVLWSIIGGNIPLFIPIILNATILTYAVTKIIFIDEATREVERIDQEVKSKVNYIKGLALDVDFLASKTNDDDQKIALQNLAQSLQMSDPMSNPSMLEQEQMLEQTIVLLKVAVEEKNGDVLKLIEQANIQLKERNKRLKLLK